MIRLAALCGSFFAAASGIIAAEDAALPDWAQYGILGLVIIALVVTRQLVPGWVYAETKAEVIELRAENKELVQQVIDSNAQAIPALREAASAIDKALGSKE